MLHKVLDWVIDTIIRPKDLRSLKWRVFVTMVSIGVLYYSGQLLQFPRIRLKVWVVDLWIDPLPKSPAESLVPFLALAALGILIVLIDLLYESRPPFES